MYSQVSELPYKKFDKEMKYLKRSRFQVLVKILYFDFDSRLSNACKNLTLCVAINQFSKPVNKDTVSNRASIPIKEPTSTFTGNPKSKFHSQTYFHPNQIIQAAIFAVKLISLLQFEISMIWNHTFDETLFVIYLLKFKCLIACLLL